MKIYCHIPKSGEIIKYRSRVVPRIGEFIDVGNKAYEICRVLYRTNGSVVDIHFISEEIVFKYHKK